MDLCFYKNSWEIEGEREREKAKQTTTPSNNTKRNKDQQQTFPLQTFLEQSDFPSGKSSQVTKGVSNNQKKHLYKDFFLSKCDKLERPRKKLHLGKLDIFSIVVIVPSIKRTKINSLIKLIFRSRKFAWTSIVNDIATNFSVFFCILKSTISLHLNPVLLRSIL